MSTDPRDAASLRTTLRAVVAICTVPGLLALRGYVETGWIGFCVIAVVLAVLAVGVWRRSARITRFTAALLMSVGFTMPVGAASPLIGMDSPTQAWSTWQSAAYIACWLLAASVLILLGWQLDRVRCAPKTRS